MVPSTLIQLSLCFLAVHCKRDSEGVRVSTNGALLVDNTGNGSLKDHDAALDYAISEADRATPTRMSKSLANKNRYPTEEQKKVAAFQNAFWADERKRSFFSTERPELPKGNEICLDLQDQFDELKEYRGNGRVESVIMGSSNLTAAVRPDCPFSHNSCAIAHCQAEPMRVEYQPGHKGDIDKKELQFRCNCEYLRPTYGAIDHTMSPQQMKWLGSGNCCVRAKKSWPKDNFDQVDSTKVHWSCPMLKTSPNSRAYVWSGTDSYKQSVLKAPQLPEGWQLKESSDWFPMLNKCKYIYYKPIPSALTTAATP